ncbi:uncharacterized protein F4812DRAFT_209560 [Daldinia caldariorum]|uniref:uncharacterized protein n=1 Tax=Daldinia caldariorum TaxID=326644 RepID=UPI00200731D1|nr:uncharacterized protein F4812DRAFT_209560 [Daldinia caldariorum]KAI1464381.1 hypothetical protein F4812DRAFT_209560 [Daldinia caldariorum]
MDNSLVIPQTGKPKRAGPGRPPKRLSGAPRGRGRPRKYERDEPEPRERLRVPKTRFVAEGSDRVTRSAVGSIPAADYAEAEVEEAEVSDMAAESSRAKGKSRKRSRVESASHGLQSSPTAESRDEEDSNPFDPDDETTRRRPRKHPRTEPESGDDQPSHAALADDNDDGDDNGYAQDGYYNFPDDVDPTAASDSIPCEGREQSDRGQAGGSTQAGDEGRRGAGLSQRTTTNAATQTAPLAPLPQGEEGLVVSPDEEAFLLRRTLQDLVPGGSDIEGIQALYWTAENERAFRELWLTYPDGALEQGDDGGENQLKLWKTMLICFDAIPLQLFTYGLKPHGGHVADTSVCLDPEFCKNLELICTHPLWDGDLGKMRYVLQQAAAATVVDHVKPVVPLIRGCQPEKHGKPNEEPGRLQRLASSQFNDLSHDPTIRSIVQKMTEDAEVMETSDEIWKMLFLLRPVHLRMVIAALDAVRPWGLPMSLYSVDEWNLHFHKRYDAIA